MICGPWEFLVPNQYAARPRDVLANAQRPAEFHLPLRMELRTMRALGPMKKAQSTGVDCALILPAEHEGRGNRGRSAK